jgi:hypothetical protein
VIEGPSKTMVPSARVTKLGASGVYLLARLRLFNKEPCFLSNSIPLIKWCPHCRLILTRPTLDQAEGVNQRHRCVCKWFLVFNSNWRSLRRPKTCQDFAKTRISPTNLLVTNYLPYCLAAAGLHLCSYHVHPATRSIRFSAAV